MKPFPEKTFLFALPFLYSVLFIVVPIYLFDTNYCWSTIVLFWIPVAALLAFNWRWMQSQGWLGPFFTTNIVIGVVSFIFEYAGLGAGAWDFSERFHSLVGIDLFGAPIEEFMFWWGATPFCVLLYTYYWRLFRKPEIFWAVVSIPFVVLTIKMYRLIAGTKVVSRMAAALTVAVFWFAVAYMERHSILREHWVYDPSKTLGIFVLGIPIEEYLIYYIIGPLFPIFFFHLMTLKPKIVFGVADQQRESGA